MRGIISRIWNRLNAWKYKKILAVMLILLTLGETAVDTTQFTDMIQSILPLLSSLIAIAIPLLFFKYIMRFIEKILSGFG